MRGSTIGFAVIFALGLGLPAPASVFAQDIEQEVAQCRKACFRTTCNPPYQSCLADRTKTRSQCVVARKSCERRCITFECAT